MRTIEFKPSAYALPPRVVGIDPLAAERSHRPGAKVARAVAELRAQLDCSHEPTKSKAPPPILELSPPCCQNNNPNRKPEICDTFRTPFYLSLPLGIEGLSPDRQHPPVYDSYGNLVPEELLDEFDRLRRLPPKPYKRRRSCSVFRTSSAIKRFKKQKPPLRIPRSIFLEPIFVTKNGYYSANAGFVRYNHHHQPLSTLIAKESVSSLPEIAPALALDQITVQKPVAFPDHNSDNTIQVEAKLPNTPLFCFITLYCNFPNNNYKYHIYIIIFPTFVQIMCSFQLLRLSMVRLQL